MVFQDSTNLNNVSKYIVDATGDTPYTTIQSAIDAANTAAVDATVYIRAGTYTENLTLYDRINLTGDSGTFGEGGRNLETLDPSVIVNGSLTLDTSALPANSYNTITDIEFSPAAGNVVSFITNAATESVLSFKGCRITVEQAGQAAFSVDGFPAIVLQNCEVWQDGVNADLMDLSGTFQFLNITATNTSFQTNSVVANTLPLNSFVHLYLNDCFYQSIIDISAPAAATFTLDANNCEFQWAGLANEPLLNYGANSGYLNISNSYYDGGSGAFSSCTDATSTEFLIKDTLFTDTYVMNVNCKEDLYGCTFFTVANTSLTMSSAQDISLNNCIVNSTNANAIDGAGAGTLSLSGTSFLNSSTVAGTVTVNKTPVFTNAQATAHEVIEITPGVAIGGVHWDGLHIDGAALDPTAANADIHGTHIDLSGVGLANDPIVVGMRIEMPAAFTGDAAKDGLVVDGFGYTAELCSGDHNVAVLSQGPIQQEYDGTGAVAGVSLAAIDSIIDYNGSTGGEIHAFDVSVSGTGTATVAALATFTDVAPIHQHIGAFGAVAQGWKENGGFTDTTVAFNAAGTDVTVFDADNDYIYIGSNAIFDVIQVILDTPATRSITPIFEYSIGGPGWTVFTPTDNTDGFTQNGSISFNSGDLAGWASVVVNAANHFYIRIQRTRNNIGTIPIEDTIQILAATEYYWDETGNTLVNTSYATTFDTNVAAAAVTLTGTTLAADGTDANIDIEITPKGTGVLLTPAIGNAADTTAIAITAAGEVNFPLQPSFLAVVSSTQTDVTGDGTIVDPIPFNEEIFDQNADYNNGTYLFTAPVTGVYFISTSIWIQGLTAAMTVMEHLIQTSNRIYYGQRNNIGGVRDNNNLCIYSSTVIADMDAADTAKATINVYNGAKVADLFGAAGQTYCSFSADLIA